MAKSPRDECFGVHDGRPARFWMDDAIIDHYGPQIGPYGLLVYMSLARHAGKGGQSNPSYKLLQNELGISRNSVRKGITALIEAGLLTMETRYSDHGDYDSNLYTLLPVGGGSPQVPPRSPQVPPHTSHDPGVGHHRYHGGSPQVPEGIHNEGRHRGRKKRERGHTAAEPHAPTLNGKRALPEDFTITEAMRQWGAVAFPHIELDQTTDEWLDACRAKDLRYKDWESAWRNNIRRAVKWEIAVRKPFTWGDDADDES